MAKRLTTIKKEVENSVESWIASEERMFGKLIGSYDYNVRIEDGIVQVCFDGGSIYDAINHVETTGCFCEETASKIFGLDKYSDWQEYASWRLDIFEG